MTELDDTDDDLRVDAADLLAVIRVRKGRGMTTSQLVAHLLTRPGWQGVGRSEARQQLRPVLRALVRDGSLVLGRGKRYFAVEHTDLLTGRLRVLGGGLGLVESDRRGGAPVRVAARSLNGALDGDRVVVRLERPRKRARDQGQLEGVVVRVVERARTSVVGRWCAAGRRSHVRPIEKALPFDVWPTGSRVDGEPGDGEIVVVSLDEVSPGDGRARGEVLERLGRLGEPGVDERVILRLHNLPEAFAPEVEAGAAALPGEITEADLEGRWDLRDRPVVTIDPETARDFDDAVNAFPAGGRGNSRDIVVEVHIADVSHFVLPGTALDAASRARSTSVYLPGRCVPMLPERVSSDLCCLREGVDRLALTVRFWVTPRGAVRRFEVGESVIHSRRRCTYEEVFGWLESPRDERVAAVGELNDCLELLAEAADRLGRARHDRGALDFELAEPEVRLDDDGRVLWVRARRRTRAHRLVEELMVTANSCVAAYLLDHDQPALHRVHDRPDPARLEDLRLNLAELGIRLDGSVREAPAQRLQQLLEEVAGRPGERMLSMLVLRSLARAVYSPEPRGHYALALDEYLHFTSPIRRYPDLVCHRLLRRLLRSGAAATGEERQGLEDELKTLGEHCSAAEQRAEAAERMAVHFKTVIHLRNRLGEAFSGVVTGVTSFGLFVQLDEVLIDGMIHVSELADDFYVYDENRHRLLGERNRKQYRLGDPIEVEVVRVDLDAMQVELTPVMRRRRRS